MPFFFVNRIWNARIMSLACTNARGRWLFIAAGLALPLAQVWAQVPVPEQPQAQAQAQAQSQSQIPTQSQSQTPTTTGSAASSPAPAAETPKDHTALGKALLNAGPDPRVRLDGQSRDHAAIFGSDDPDEQALMEQERTLDSQRTQLQMLERLMNQKPATADPHPPAMIPLNPGAPMTMPKLAPTPSGSQLDRGGSDTRRRVDEMQRRVNGLRREADTLGQGAR